MLLLLPILIPLAAAFGAYFVKERAARNIIVIAASAVCAIFFLVCGRIEARTLWAIADGITVTVRLDGVGQWFAVLINCVWLAAGIYAGGYMEHEERQDRFFMFWMCTLAALNGLCVSANIITFYMFYEMMTLLSMPLVVQERTKEAIAAGIKYLLYSVFGASMALLGVFLLARYSPTLDFTAGGVLNETIRSEHGGIMRAAAFLMLLGFGVKAGLFPLHGWLPTAHPVAPAPASAVLSGVITKAGVLGSLRAVYFLFGRELLSGSWVQTAWMTLTLITVFLGSMMAYRENIFKKRLAYSTVSQVSYVLFGLSTMTEAGFIGALLHVCFHSVIKNCLFMGAGAVIHQTGKTDVRELRGLGARMPATLWCFLIASAGLIGIPPTAGFISKWYLAEGALALSGTVRWLGPCVLLISAILTAGYLLSIVINAFFVKADDGITEKCEPHWNMLIPMIILAAAVLLLGLLPGGLLSLAGSLFA